MVIPLIICVYDFIGDNDLYQSDLRSFYGFTVNTDVMALNTHGVVTNAFFKSSSVLSKGIEMILALKSLLSYYQVLESKTHAVGSIRIKKFLAGLFYKIFILYK